jgi:tetratricopeptide (TPR) repeat protein
MVWRHEERVVTRRICFASALAVIAGFVAQPVAARAIGMDQIRQCDGSAKVSTEAAIAACSQILASSEVGASARPQFLLSRSHWYFFAHQPDKALADLNALLKLKPDDTGLLTDRGLVYTSIGQYGAALEDFDAALKRNPNNGVTLANRAKTKLHVEDWAGAIDDYNLAIRIGPAGAQLLCERGEAKARLHTPADAIEDYSAALAIDPDSECALQRRGFAYSQTGDYAKALDDFDRFAQRNAPNFEIYNSRCWARAVLNRELDLALADCEKSLALNPGLGRTLDSRGFVHLRMGDNKAAIADYDAALAAEPKLASSLFCRGIAKHRNGDNDGGDTDIAAAKAIDPKIAERYAGYGVTP